MQDEHELRKTYDAQLRELANGLRADPEQAAKVEQAKLQLLEHPKMREWLTTLWGNGQGVLVDGAADPESDLRRTIESLTVRAGEVLRDDAAVGAKVDEALQRMTGHVMTHYAEDMAGVISATVERWDTAETSRRLELAGRPGPSVHPHQRHRGRRAGRPRDLRDQPAVLNAPHSTTLCSWGTLSGADYGPGVHKVGVGAAAARGSTRASTASAASHTRQAPNMCSPTSRAGTCRKYWT